MLIKKELAQLPLLDPPEIPNDENRYYRKGTAAAAIHELPRSGRVLVADFYSETTQKLHMRFFTDGENFITCDGWPAVSWGKKSPKGNDWCSGYYSTKEDDALAKEFLKDKRNWYHSLADLLADMASSWNYEQREKRIHGQKQMKEKHFAMYPKLPKNLGDWCDEHLFSGGYIFFTKKNPKGVREARCGVCGHEFEPAGDVKHNKRGHCPRCGRLSVYKAEWIRKPVSDTKKLCIAERVDGNLLLRWMDVTRHFGPYHFKKTYSFQDAYYNLHLKGAKATTVYSYQLLTYGWNRKRNGDICTNESRVYTDNLDAVFGRRFHGVDIREIAAIGGEHIRFGKLLNDLEEYPQTEYLLKMGLTELAGSVSKLVSQGEKGQKGFTELLGVSRQLLPVYQRMNVTYNEHRMIRAYGKWVSEEDIENLRLLRIEGNKVDAAEAVLQKMTIQKFNNYFWKQRRLNPDRTAGHLVIEYRDYLEMSLGLNIDLSHKAVRYPSDLVEAHSRLLGLFNTLDDKNHAVDEAFAAAVAPIYEQIGFTEYEGKEFSVVFPKLRSDLITEGTSLSHCVGRMENYYKNHMAGTKMIFFLRKNENPAKPFFTMEVDMTSFQILQLYGFGDSPAPEKVRKFAESFVQHLSKAWKKGREIA